MAGDQVHVSEYAGQRSLPVVSSPHLKFWTKNSPKMLLINSFFGEIDMSVISFAPLDEIPELADSYRMTQFIKRTFLNLSDSFSTDTECTTDLI